MEWEYHVEEVKTDAKHPEMHTNATAYLNKAAKDGWELVTVAVASGPHYLYMRRRARS